MACGRPPRHLNLKNFYGSPDNNKHKFTLQKNGLNNKNYSEHAEYFLTFCLKKNREGGRAPPPLI